MDEPEPTETTSQAAAATATPKVPSQAQQRSHLRKMLGARPLNDRLADLTDIAISSSRKGRKQDQYMPLTGVVCDGVEICLGLVDVHEVRKRKLQLRNLLHAEITQLSIKNILVKDSNIGANMWLTLQDDSIQLDCDFMDRILRV